MKFAIVLAPLSSVDVMNSVFFPDAGLILRARGPVICTHSLPSIFPPFFTTLEIVTS